MKADEYAYWQSRQVAPSLPPHLRQDLGFSDRNAPSSSGGSVGLQSYERTGTRLGPSGMVKGIELAPTGHIDLEEFSFTGSAQLKTGFEIYVRSRSPHQLEINFIKLL